MHYIVIKRGKTRVTDDPKRKQKIIYKSHDMDKLNVVFDEKSNEVIRNAITVSLFENKVVKGMLYKFFKKHLTGIDEHFRNVCYGAGKLEEKQIVDKLLILCLEFNIKNVEIIYGSHDKKLFKCIKVFDYYITDTIRNDNNYKIFIYDKEPFKKTLKSFTLAKYLEIKPKLERLSLSEQVKQIM